MAEYVSREKMMALFNKYHPRMATSVIDYWTELERLPSEVVTPVRRGRWENYGDSDHLITVCSECGQKKPVLSGNCKINFCPNCGAKIIKPYD